MKRGKWQVLRYVERPYLTINNPNPCPPYGGQCFVDCGLVQFFVTVCGFKENFIVIRGLKKICGLRLYELFRMRFAVPLNTFCSFYKKILCGLRYRAALSSTKCTSTAVCGFTNNVSVVYGFKRNFHAACGLSPLSLWITYNSLSNDIRRKVSPCG